MTEVKFCKDCKWYEPSMWSPISGDFAKCLRPNNSINYLSALYLVNKHPEKIDVFCEIERRRYYGLDVCGPEAKYFERRKTFWERILELFKERLHDFISR